MTQIQYTELNQHLKDKIYSIGIDEVGYGSAAGMLCVCGVKAPKDWSVPGLNDSKKLSSAKREAMRGILLKIVTNKVIEFHIAERTNVEIDQYGLGVMLKDCYIEIFRKLYTNDSLLICDGNLDFGKTINSNYDQVSIIKADTLVPSVMAASILAKTYRDEKMKKFHLEFPQYGWNKNVGYLTPSHILAIKNHGLCSLHRHSYKIKSLNNYV